MNMDLIVQSNPQGIVKGYQSQEPDCCGGNLVTENSAINVGDAVVNPIEVQDAKIIMKQHDQMKIVECGTEESLKSAQPVAPPYTN